MSRSTYALIAYKQSFAGDMPKEDVMARSRALSKELYDVIKRHGADLCSISEVALAEKRVEKRLADYYGKASFADASSEKPESEIMYEDQILGDLEEN